MYVLVPMTYEKWVNPANKNDKHYRVVFRSPSARRVGKTKFKRASDIEKFSLRWHRRVCNKQEGNDAIRGQGDIRA
jgi:hypothetical protein